MPYLFFPVQSACWTLTASLMKHCPEQEQGLGNFSYLPGGCQLWESLVGASQDHKASLAREGCLLAMAGSSGSPRPNRNA